MNLPAKIVRLVCVKRILKYRLFALVIMLIKLNASGQNIDSLKLALKSTAHDTTKGNILKVLATVAANEEQMGYTEELKTLVERNLSLNPPQTIKDAYKKHLSFVMRKNGVFYYAQGDYKKGISYFLKGLKLSEEVGDKTQIGRTFANLAVGYHSIADYRKALEYFHKGLKLSEDIGDKHQAGRSLNNLANLYYDEGDYPKALDYYFKALKLNEETGDKQQMGITMGNIANVLEKNGDHQKALEYYEKGLKISESVGDRHQEGMTLGNIGGVYSKFPDYPKAKDFYFKGLKILEEVGDKYSVAIMLGNIAITYQKELNYPKALDYYLKGLKVSEEMGNKRQVSITLGNIGNIYIDMHKYSEAENCLNRALVISKEIGARDGEKLHHSNLSLLYEKTNRPALALEHFKQFIALRDSIYSEENTKKSMRSEMNYEYEKKAQELKFEQEKKDIQANEEKKKQNIITYSVAAGLVLVLSLAIFIFRGYRRKQKDNLIIMKQKHEVEESKKEIIDSIHYAKRIQSAQIPSEKYIQKSLNRLQKKS